MATMAAAAGRGDAIGVLTRIACASADPRDAEKTATEKTEALLASIARGDDGAAITALLLSNGARVDAGEREGETLATVAAATRAGCAREGTTFALLRHYADAQGVAIARRPRRAPEGRRWMTGRRPRKRGEGAGDFEGRRRGEG